MRKQPKRAVKIKRRPRVQQHTEQAAQQQPHPEAAHAAALLDDALLAKVAANSADTLHAYNNSNALLLAPASASSRKPAAASTLHSSSSAVARPRPLTKRQQRKLRKLAEHKANKSEAIAAFASLSSHSLTPQHRRLLRSTGELGKQETQRQRLRRAFRQEKAGIGGDDAKDLLSRRKRRRLNSEAEADSSSAPEREQPATAVVSSYGLAPERWRQTAGAAGSIAFDTQRSISYGSSDDEDEEGQDGHEEDEARGSAESEDEAERMRDDEPEDEEQKEEGSLAASSGQSRSGLFSVAFDVIAASNRPKRKRRVIISRGRRGGSSREAEQGESEEQEQEQEQQQEDKAEDAKQDEGNANDTDLQLQASQPVVEDEHRPMNDADAVTTAAGAEEAEERPAETAESAAPATPLQTSEPLISVRGKTRLAPLSSLSTPHFLAAAATVQSASSSAGGGRFVRTTKPALVPQPQPAGSSRYVAGDDRLLVSRNLELTGEEGAGVSEQLDVLRKGEAIVEDAEAADDSRPHLWTRQLEGGRCVAYLNRRPELQQARRSLPIAAFEQEIIEALQQQDIVLIAGETGSGKCFAAGTRLRLHNGGTQAVETFTGGERLMGDDGSPRVVTPGSLARGRARMYRIRPAASDFSAFNVNGDHILVLVNTRPPWKRRRRNTAGRPHWEVCCYALDASNGMRELITCTDTEQEADAQRDGLLQGWKALEWEVSVQRFLATPERIRRRCRLLQSGPVRFDSTRPRLQDVLSRLLCSPPSSAQLAWAAWLIGLSLRADCKGKAWIPCCRQRTTALRARLREYEALFHQPLPAQLRGLNARGAANNLHEHAVGCDSIAVQLLRAYRNLLHAEDAFLDTLEVRRCILAGVADASCALPVQAADERKAADSQCCAVRAAVDAVCKSLGIRPRAFHRLELVRREKLPLDSSQALRKMQLLSPQLRAVLQRCVLPVLQLLSRQPLQNEQHAEVRARCLAFSIAQLAEGDYYGFAVTGANRRFLLDDFIVTHNTTQLPQFLFENGFGFGSLRGRIGVTQPRRVAAVTTCQRVAEEMNLPLSSSAAAAAAFNPAATLQHIALINRQRQQRGLPVEDASSVQVHTPYDVVAHAVRYDSRVRPSTLIAFMTDGLLLREVAADFLLSAYSCVVVDEAHERGRNTDVLIGLLSRSVRMRRRRWDEAQGQQAQARCPLKLIIMSATLRTADFTDNTRLFPSPPPVLSIPSRQHKVVVHHSRRTVLDGWLQATLAKLMRMHCRLPAGGILVFLTGKEDIDWMCAKVDEVWKDREKRRSRSTLLDDEEKSKQTAAAGQSAMQTEVKAASGPKTADEEEQALYALGDDDNDGSDEAVRERKVAEADADAAQQAARDRMETELDDIFASSAASSASQPALTPYCLPLYSLLPSELQLRVFSAPPTASHRLIVVATNVAETSLTIPGIRYVLDSGREKRKLWEARTGCSRLTVDWISQASAEQRKGRAGRTGPGHVYRMYSAAVCHELMPQQAEPEVLREPLDSLVLTMKAMGIRRVRQFPFPTPPAEDSLRRAEQLLLRLGAVTAEDGAVTELGRGLSRWPVAPRYGKMLMLGHQGGCLQFIIAIVSALSVEQLLLNVRMRDSQQHQQDGDSDADGSDDDEAEKSDRVKAKERRKQQRKQLHERLMKARQRWQHQDSDLLTYLRVIGGYDFATRGQEGRSGREPREERDRRRRQRGQLFCSENFVRQKAMDEVQLLRRQLTRIAVDFVKGRKRAGEGEEVRGEDVEPDDQQQLPGKRPQDSVQTRQLLSQLVSPMRPPTVAQERLIRQLLLTGLVDQVARRLSEEERQRLSGQDGPSLAGGYALLSSPHPAFLHPSSVLFPASAQPLYLCYASLSLSASSARQYMRDCTVIEEEALLLVADAAGLVQWGAWLDAPRPVWSRERDRVEGWKRPCLVSGDTSWELSVARRGWDDGQQAAAGARDEQQRVSAREAREFVRLLLQGDVLEALRPFLPFLAVSPNHLSIAGAALRGRLLDAVQLCVRDGVRSVRQLRLRWAKDRQYMLREVQAWLQPVKHDELQRIWPPQH